MENKLNYPAIEQYCRAYAEKVSQNWYSEHSVIKGKEILSVTSLQQVNLFTIKNLFFKWKKEAQRLQSPYFDYTADDVKDALSTFMNVLSQHIVISRESFTPLLTQSVEDTLLLIVSPYTYFKREVHSPSNDRVSLEYLKDLRKYVKVNFNILDAIIREFERKQIDSANSEDALRLFQDVFNGLEGEPAELSDFVDLFSEVVPLDLNALYQIPAEAESKVQNIVAESIDADKDDAERRTLNDTFEEVDKNTLVQELQFAKITNLKESLSVNQKFMFINKLFDGDSAMFHEALNRIETLGSAEEAIAVLQTDFTVSSSWDQESDEVVEFMELLDRRFK